MAHTTIISLYPKHFIDIRVPPGVQENAALVIISILALILLFTIFCFSTRKRVAKPSTSLEALLTIMTPTSVAWPTDYDVLFKHSTSPHSMSIKIRLSQFLRNVGAGTVELKDLNDLPHLFCRQLRAYGWLVSLDVDFFLWTSVLRWILVSQIPGCITNATATGNLKTRPHHEQIAFKDGLDQGAGTISSEDNQTNNYLDFLPYPDLESSIRTVQSRLRPGSSALFEFTTISPNISFLSDQFIFCCLPFMPRKYLLQQDSPCRTSTPLLTSLHHITEILSTGPSTVSIQRIANVTAEHITTLQIIEQSLVTDRVRRLGLISKWGIEGWREHRLMIAWEAGLLSAGYLQRWNVVVRK